MPFHGFVGLLRVIFKFHHISVTSNWLHTHIKPKRGAVGRIGLKPSLSSQYKSTDIEMKPKNYTLHEQKINTFITLGYYVIV